MAAGGDLDAFNQLVLDYQDIAFSHACALVHDAAAAEDITQESFIKAFRGLGRYRGGSFRAWLLKIVTNTAYDQLRWHKRNAAQHLFPEDEDGDEIESPGWMIDLSAAVEKAVEEGEETGRLYRLLAELPPAYQSVLTLVDLHELDYEEAAGILNLPLGTVKSRLARARRMMRAKIGPLAA